MILQCCHQMRFEDLSEDLIKLCDDEVETLLRYEDKGLVQFVKGKSKDTFFQRARLSKHGSKVLEDLGTAIITEEDIIIWDWLVGFYRKEGKEIGNSKKGKLWLASFRVESGIDRNRLSFLCQKFITDETQMDYSHRLDYVFFKPPNIHSVKFDIEESKLWKYYNRSKAFFDARFETILQKEQNATGNL